MSTPGTIVSVTPIAVERDSRTLKQATSLARLGYRSIVIEGERSALDSSDLPFELVAVAGAPPPPSEGSLPNGFQRNADLATAVPEPEADPKRRPWGNLWPGLVSRYWRSRWAWNDLRFRLKVDLDSYRRTYRALPAADLYVLHSYAQFPAVFMASVNHSGRIAYDAHDSYFEMDPRENSARERAMARIERICVRLAAGFTTVSGGVADILEERHRRRPLVLRNCHDLRLDQPAGKGGLRDVLGLTEKEFVLVSVGNYKGGMSAREAMLALTKLPEHVHLVFVGRGFAPAREWSRELGLEERVHFPGAVPPAQVANFVESADVGLVLYSPVSRSYLHALPNGFFQVIAAGLPVLYPKDLPEVRAVAERHELGLPVDPTDPASVADGVRELIDDPDRRERLRGNAGTARDAESWEREEQILDTYVDSILGDQAATAAGTGPTARHASGTESPRHVRGALLLYHRPALFPDAATITDHINSFEGYSRFPFWKVNTDRGFPKRLAGVRFDAIVVHYSVFASGPSPYLLDESFLEYLDDSDRSYKVAFFQDEHQYCQKRFTFLDQYGFDCVYTCLEPEYFDQTYRRYTRVPDLVNHVPAYVHPDMVATAERLRTADAERELDIGYRARPTPPFFGRGGMEKVEIAEEFLRRTQGGDLKLDVSIREQDRLYGENWYRLMARSKGFLGTESGASCVDLEDEVREEYERLLAAGENPTIERLEQGSLGRWDWKVPLRTTSARHFEAAAFRTCQIMYEGRYSGALRPMEHYIPLKKDYSNFDEVIERFRDADLRRELTENAYRDLIGSGEHSYERFIAGFDKTLTDAGLEPPAQEIEKAPVSRSLRGIPPHRVARRYLGGASFWLYRRHPSVWKYTVPPVMWFVGLVGLASLPFRVLARLAKRERPSTS